MLSHLEYPDDIKNELYAEIEEALNSAYEKAEEAEMDMEAKLEEYREIQSYIENMRGMF
jgi:hypothetical protein